MPAQERRLRPCGRAAIALGVYDIERSCARSDTALRTGNSGPRGPARCDTRGHPRTCRDMGASYVTPAADSRGQLVTRGGGLTGAMLAMVCATGARRTLARARSTSRKPTPAGAGRRHCATRRSRPKRAPQHCVLNDPGPGETIPALAGLWMCPRAPWRRESHPSRSRATAKERPISMRCVTPRRLAGRALGCRSCTRSDCSDTRIPS